MDRRMKKKDATLIVPELVQERNKIRSLSDAFCVRNDILPPASYPVLATYADELLKSNDLAKEYHAFAMVCLGNSIWKRVVEKIPYDRRILLLPQCLSSSNSCKAETDEFGLLCSECGACSIGGILHEAEELGYTTLVAEGTTIATKLIENCTADAIIGVGCMDSLKESFSLMNKYAIPGFGIPLLTNGCKDTKVDLGWVRKEILGYDNPEGATYLRVHELMKDVEGIFAEERFKEILGEPESSTEAIARKYILEGGKRIRPFLAVVAYHALCQEPDAGLAARLAIAIEYFHKASLVHDDIEDNDASRDGVQALHDQYNVPVALNTGDLMLGEGYRILSGCNVAPDILSACIRIASQGHVALCNGQGTELMAGYQKNVPSCSEMIEMYKLKTGGAFKVSLLLGAVAAGASQEELDQLEKISDLAGIAYQLKDDLEDFNDKQEDIVRRGFSYILSEFFDEMPSKERKFSELPDMDIIEEIKRKEIPQQTEKILVQYIRELYRELENVHHLKLKLVLYHVFGKVFHRYL